MFRPQMRTPVRLAASAGKARPLRYSFQSQSGLRKLSTETERPAGSKINNVAIIAGLSVLGIGTVLYNRREKPVTTAVQTANQRGQNTSSDDDLYPFPAEMSEEQISKLPVEKAVLTTAPHVPPPITRDHPVRLEVDLTSTEKTFQMTSQYKYEGWTFNDTIPGPFIRARVGDFIELTFYNKDESGRQHNIDSHAFTGPGGGAALTTAESDGVKKARFRLLSPGLFVYHCAANPVPVHIANGMYGLIYVQPEKDIPPVDKEYYVLQSEFYHEPPQIGIDGRPEKMVEFSYPDAVREEPNVVVFNGSDTSLTKNPLTAKTGETVRLFFGNAGPNLTSSFHVIGSHFRKVYRDGGVVSPPADILSTVSVPPGGTTITDLQMIVPGNYTLVDHAIFRLEKGAAGYLSVTGQARPDVYASEEPPAPCPGCKLHP